MAPSARAAKVTNRTSAEPAGAEATRPHDFKSWGFFCGPKVFALRRTENGRDREGATALPRRRGRAARGARWSRETSAAMVDLKFCDLLGTWQHVTLPSARSTVGVRRGPRFRRLLDPRLAGDRRERHAADAGRVDRDPRSVHRGPPRSAPCEIAEPVTYEPYAKDPRRGREAGGGIFNTSVPIENGF